MTAGLRSEFIWGDERELAAVLGARASGAATDATLTLNIRNDAAPAEELTADA